MAANPQFTITPISCACTVSVANPNLDGAMSGTVVSLVPRQSAPGRIDRFKIQALGDTPATYVRIWIDRGPESQPRTLFLNIPVKAIVTSMTVAPFEADLVLDYPILLPVGHSLVASVHTGTTFAIHAMGGLF